MAVLSFGTVLLHSMRQRTALFLPVFDPEQQPQHAAQGLGRLPHHDLQIRSPPPDTAPAADDEKQRDQKHQKAHRKNGNDEDRQSQRQRADAQTAPVPAPHGRTSFPSRLMLQYIPRGVVPCPAGMEKAAGFPAAFASSFAAPLPQVLELVVEPQIARVPRGGELPCPHSLQNGAALFLRVAAANEAAAVQIGCEIQKGLR